MDQLHSDIKFITDYADNGEIYIVPSEEATDQIKKDYGILVYSGLITKYQGKYLLIMIFCSKGIATKETINLDDHQVKGIIKNILLCGDEIRGPLGLLLEPFSLL